MIRQQRQKGAPARIEVQAGSVDSDRLTLAPMIEAVRQGRVAIVVVSSLDRLARDPHRALSLSRSSRPRVSFVQPPGRS